MKQFPDDDQFDDDWTHGDAIWSGMIDDIQGVAAMTEQELQEREAESRKRDGIREAAAVLEYTEKHLACPTWFTIEKWRAPEKAYGVLGDIPADIFSSINEMAIGRSGIIIGPTNHGKTHLACAIARETGKRAVRYKDSYLRRMFEINKYRHSEYFETMLHEAKTCDLFLWDDLGKNRCHQGDEPTPFGNLMIEIMDERAENHRQTIATTRYCNGELLDDRMSEDLLRRLYQIEDKRKTHVMIFLGG